MNHCRIHPRSRPGDPAIVARFAGLPTSIVSDSQERVGGAPGILPIAPFPLEQRVAGPALTVRTRGGDNLAIHQALRLLRPGDVLTIDGGGHLDRAVLGEIMLRQAKASGAAAIVVDGVVRDRDGIVQQGLPVLARGVCHLGPYKNGPGEIHGAIRMGDTVVRDGDMVVADNDGVVFVASDRAERVLEIAEGRARAEETILASASRGELDFSWLDESLEIERLSDVSDEEGD